MLQLGVHAGLVALPIIALLFVTGNSTLTGRHTLPVSSHHQRLRRHAATWAVPSYAGLVIGQSTSLNVKREFGAPVWQGPPEEKLIDSDKEPEILYEYESVGGLDGRTTVVLGKRSHVVKAISLYPRNMSRDEAVKQFGDDFIEMPSGLGPCPTPDERRRFTPSARLEYPIFLDYPRRGLYVSIQRDGTVGQICYLIRCP